MNSILKFPGEENSFEGLEAYCTVLYNFRKINMDFIIEEIDRDLKESNVLFSYKNDCICNIFTDSVYIYFDQSHI